MPFSTDANWPQGLLDIFNINRNQNAPLESRYYGPYDRLFNYALVEGSFTFYLTLLTAPDETSARDVVDFMVVLNQEQKPVLFAEIKDDRWANEPYTRQRADTQMRQLYKQMLPNSAIPHLYGLSLLGTSLRVYRGDKVTGTITPHFVGRPHADRIFPPDFLGGQWDLDILSPDGLKKMQEIVTYIKEEATNVMGQ
ncbi:hypothetical protein EDB92DRAFT_1797158 [Lactarius akahatsu]|uniref:Uncharacterized protein n=1 Tax=Lactarius akahatsu TaxID=416441 RepID=A0AAD4Q8J5_9AGAM|nr:hypothetical protein EDB92DRAFT_1797158 [Lactarius akahatsu]